MPRVSFITNFFSYTLIVVLSSILLILFPLTFTNAQSIPNRTPPKMFGVPSQISILATSSLDIPVTYNIPFAFDNIDGTTTASCSPFPNSLFSIGITKITCSAQDLSNNIATKSFNLTIQDTVASITLPIIASDSATIRWNTFGPSISRVDYGLTSEYGSSTTNLDLTISHSVVVSGLLPNTTYHYRLTSIANNSISFSDDLTFTTEAAGFVSVISLPALSEAISNHPSRNFKLANDYDASLDGTYSTAAIQTALSGTFDGQGHTISNLTILDATENASRLGLFLRINPGGAVRNLKLSGGSITSTGVVTSLSPEISDLIGQQVGALAAQNYGTIDNVSSTVSVSNSAAGSQVGGLVAQNYMTGIISNVECNGSISITSDAFNTYQSNCVGLNLGLITNASVTSGSLYAPSGNSSRPTLTCQIPPCPTTGSWMGPIAGANGWPSGTISTAIISSSSASISPTNSTNIDSANFTGGLVGNNLDGKIINSFATGNVSGGSSVGGLVGRSSYTSSIITNSYASGNVTGNGTSVGGLTGDNAGSISKVYATGNVSGKNSAGGLVGTNRTNATIQYGVSFGQVNGLSGVGGVIGHNQGMSSQAYSVGRVRGGSNVGGYVGSDSRDTGNTSSYWNITTSNVFRSSGNVASSSGISGLTDTQLKSVLPAGFDSTWNQNSAIAGGYPYILNLTPPQVPTSSSTSIQIVLTAAGTNSWVIPDNWNSSTNIIEAIGEGGCGASATISAAGRGGGGGAYSKILNFNAIPGETISYTLGAGCSLIKTQFNNSSTLVADFGTNGSVSSAGQGGLVNNSVGKTRYSGGSGHVNTGNCSGAGGGGAAGPNGAGKGGGAPGCSKVAGGGGGGGAADNGLVGVAGTISAGGNGGSAADTTLGGIGSNSPLIPGGIGSRGSGGGGGFATTTLSSAGGKGSSNNAFGSVGVGGGGGGGGGLLDTLTNGADGGAGGSYGGGGGGGGRGTTVPGTGGFGGQGAIIITYWPN